MKHVNLPTVLQDKLDNLCTIFHNFVQFYTYISQGFANFLNSRLAVYFTSTANSKLHNKISIYHLFSVKYYWWLATN